MFHLGLLRSSQSLRVIVPRYFNGVRSISTSGKNRETVSPTVEKVTENCETENKDKNWVSYGFDFHSREEDQNTMNAIMFGCVSLCMVFGGFIWAYMPEIKLRDWAQREAYLELRRRESQGLPPIDRNLIDPATVQLPSDEELGDTEIII